MLFTQTELRKLYKLRSNSLTGPKEQFNLDLFVVPRKISNISLGIQMYLFNPFYAGNL